MHAICGDAQTGLHLPVMHWGVLFGHALPHSPQLFQSIRIAVHLPLQLIVPAGHWHLPAVQDLGCRADRAAGAAVDGACLQVGAGPATDCLAACAGDAAPRRAGGTCRTGVTAEAAIIVVGLQVGAGVTTECLTARTGYRSLATAPAADFAARACRATGTTVLGVGLQVSAGAAAEGFRTSAARAARAVDAGTSRAPRTTAAAVINIGTQVVANVVACRQAAGAADGGRARARITVLPAGHTLPHAPQLLESVCVLVQEPLQ